MWGAVVVAATEVTADVPSTGVTTPAPRPSLAATLLGAALALPMIGPALADSPPERGLVALKVLDYLDSQPGADRIRVRAPALNLQLPIAGDWLLDSTLISDAISGASPAFHSRSLKRLTDQRYALQSTATRYFGNGSLSAGVSYSTERDYVSRGVSLQGSRSSDDKNTTWTAGIGYSSDQINPANQPDLHERKRVADVLVGLTQVLGTHDIVQLNLRHARSQGYHTDPYKVFDNRPRQRHATTLLARWNHHVEATEGTLRLSWRGGSDSFGIASHTFGAEWVQPLPGGWTLTPQLRLYTQSAARFYVDADASTAPFPPNPPEGAVYFTEDHRMSAFGAHTWGLKLAKQINADWSMDVKFERYGQRAEWRLFGSGSPGLAPFNARSWQLGIARQF